MYKKLLTLLPSAPVLNQIDLSQPDTLRTDANDYALGTVLTQGTEKDERPAKYVSRLLTSAEGNYTTTERAALAIVRYL